MNILVINPGGTSTKIAVYNNEKQLFFENINHTAKELKKFSCLFDEFDYRKKIILDILDKNNYKTVDFQCVVGRGGLMKPIKGGTYKINEKMISDMENAINGEHASNLGSVIAKRIGDEIGAPSFVVDPVSVDEFNEISRITGLKEIEKASWLHALNHKAVCREISKKYNIKYEASNFIVAHLGSGISIAAHKKGKMIDGSGGRSDGPFSPERSGGLLTYDLIKLCYSGKYTKKEMIDKVSKYCGFYDYLQTKNLIEVEEKIEKGNNDAKLIMEAFIYQVSKEISMYGATLKGKINKIILTGGISNSNLVVEGIKERVNYLADVEVVPGEMEMKALALGAIRVLEGYEKAKIY